MKEKEVVNKTNIGNGLESKRINNMLYAIIACVLAIIAIVGIIYFYSGYSRRVSVERGKYLSELSAKIAENTDINIQNRWNYALGISNVAIRSEVNTKTELIGVMKETRVRSSVNDVEYVAIDTKGNFYCSDGTEGKWGEGDKFFKQKKEEKKVFIKSFDKVSISKPQILFVCKTAKTVKLDKGIKINYVAYMQPLKNFARNMDIAGYKYNQILQIIDKSGDILYSHNQIDNIPNKDNIDDVLAKSKFLDGGSLKIYRSNIRTRKVNSQKFIYKGESYYLSYAPIDIDDWGILHVLPVDDIGDEVGQFFTYSLYSIIGVAICLCLLIIIVIKMTMTLKNNMYLLGIKEESNKALKKAADEANYANKAKSDFLAHMSHDIRTPINGIVGMTNIAKLNLDDKDKVEKCLDKIIISSNHLVSLINDVLDMSRIETGKYKIKNSKMNIINVYQQCVAIVGTQAQEHSLILENEVGEIQHPNVIGDELHLKQILINILGNAVKFTHDEGKIIFSLKEISSSDSKVKFLFTISDNGIGMSEEYQKHVFETFTQEEDGSRTTYQGTGLGMAIAKNFIDLMGGSIEVNSKINKGTTFKVELEFDIDKEDIEEESDSQNNKLDGMKVLLAEDNELNKEIIESILEEENINVVSAMDGKEAIDMFKKSEIGEYDVILMDIMMPEMDGLTATKNIRELPREDAKTVAIIAMTANAYEEDVNKSLEAGMNEHLTKPIDYNKLFAILDKYKR